MHTERSQASTQSSEDRGRSLEKAPKGKKTTKKGESGDLKRTKANAKLRKTRKES